jgi:hypothetical protein
VNGRECYDGTAEPSIISAVTEVRMHRFDSPFFVFAVVLIVQWLAAYAGDAFRRKVHPLKKEGDRQGFDIVRTASLTLLGLIIGFSFAMAVNRYDQRKNLEEAEANAIGTGIYVPTCCLLMMHLACATCSENTAMNASHIT